MNLCNPRVVRDLMESAGIRFRKEYGQNFLVNPEVPERIAEMSCDDPDTVILEIGPGIGTLTQELAERFRRVIAVEIDRGLIPILGKTLSEYDNVDVVNADVMKLDLPSFLHEKTAGEIGTRFAVCANLPYYITTPILMALLESGVPFSSITVMVQKEVADRLCTSPGSSDYGAITAVLAYYGQARKLFTVPNSSFMPPPKVESAVVRIDLYRERPFSVPDEKLFFRLIHGAFEMRRKTLVNALAAKCPEYDKQGIESAITSLGLDKNVRGERLSCEDFARLSSALLQNK